MEPKYAAPPANPASTHGTVNACKRIYQSRSPRCCAEKKRKKREKHTISHFRFPRRIARYSDQGNESLVVECILVDFERIDDRMFLRELPTTACLGERESRVDGKGRREEVAMTVRFLVRGGGRYKDQPRATCVLTRLTCPAIAASSCPLPSHHSSRPYAG